MNMLRNVVFLYNLILVFINVIFKIVLFNCLRLLFDMNEIWKIVNYGEMKFNNKIEFIWIFLFKERNIFDIYVEFKLKGDICILKRSIILGKMKLKCSKIMINFKEEIFNVNLMVLNEFEFNKKRNDVGFIL